MSGRSHGLRRWFWGGFLLILLAGLLLALFALVRSGQQWAQFSVQQTQVLPPVWKQVIQVTLGGGESLYLEPATLSGIRSQADHWLGRRRIQVQDAMQRELTGALDPVFDQALALVPAFADWYYSLSGEYLRLFHAVSGDLPEFLAERLELLVFQPADTAAGLDRVLVSLDGQLARQMQTAAADYQVLLADLLHRHRLDPDGVEVQVQGTWSPAEDISHGLQPFVALSAKDLGRQGLATGAGVAASSLVFKKLGASTVAKTSSLIAAKQSASVLAALASKLGLKTLAKGGVLAGAGTGAASGAGLCAASVVGAPLAPGCALLGGVLSGAAAWVLVDKVVIEADELLNREDLERQMRSALQQQRDELEMALARHYRELADSGFAGLGAGPDVPVRAQVPETGAQPQPQDGAQ